MCRASATSSAIACSAVVTLLPSGVFMTTMPRAVAAGDVDVVDADAGAADHLELRRGLDHLARHLGAAPDHEALDVRHRLQEGVALQAGRVDGLDPARRLQDGEPFLRERVADQHLGHRVLRSVSLFGLRARAPNPGARGGSTARGERSAAAAPRIRRGMQEAAAVPPHVTGRRDRGSWQAPPGMSNEGRVPGVSTRSSPVSFVADGEGSARRGRGAQDPAPRTAGRQRPGARLAEHRQPRAGLRRARAGRERARRDDRERRHRGDARGPARARRRDRGRRRPLARHRHRGPLPPERRSWSMRAPPARPPASSPRPPRSRPGRPRSTARRACARARSPSSPTRSARSARRSRSSARTAARPCASRAAGCPAARRASTRGARAST